MRWLSFLPSPNPQGGCRPHRWVCKSCPGRAARSQQGPPGSPLTRASSLLCFCVSVFAASSCVWDSDRSCLNCRGGAERKTEKKKSSIYALGFGALWPKEAFLWCNIFSKRPRWHHLLTCLLIPAQRDGGETAPSHLSHGNLKATGEQWTASPYRSPCPIILPMDLLTLRVYNQDRSKHLHLSSLALQSCRSLGHSPNPRNTDGQ